MKIPPDYKIWIYSVNTLLIIMQVVFVYYITIFLQHRWIKYFPLSQWSVYQLFASVSIQFLVCSSGIIGAYLSSRKLLRVYWILTIPFLIYDVIRGIQWSMNLHDIHKHYSAFLSYTVKNTKTSTQICSEWRELQTMFKCCAPFINSSCNFDTEPLSAGCKSCIYPLLRWFHSRIDIAATVAYFIMYPLKFIIVIVLRKDIHEFFAEILYAGNKELYKHWVDQDSVACSQKSSIAVGDNVPLIWRSVNAEH